MMLASLLLLPLLQLPAAGAQSEIRPDDLRAHITFLASDEMEGRESGKRGGHLAARYVAAHFAGLGLQPLEGHDYRIPFELGELTCYNVVAVIPGTDPALADRYVAIGGHHDHAGIGGPGAMSFPDEVHNGADDNASGTAGVLELAEYLVAHPLRRSVLVMTFSAEERGLLGSEQLVKSRTLPVDQIDFMLNCDMIGRSGDGYVFVGGLGTAAEFHTLLDPVLDGSALRIEQSDMGEAPSDNTSFFKAGIPSLFFFTNIHEDYHRPGDDAEKIDYDNEARILELILEITRTLDAAGPLSFIEARGMGMPADFMPRMMQHMADIESYKNANRGKLGVRGSEVRDGGVVVEGVTEGGSAEMAGVRAGDVLMRVGETRTRDLRALRIALRSQRRGAELELVVSRDGKELNLQATLQ